MDFLWSKLGAIVGGYTLSMTYDPIWNTYFVTVFNIYT